MVLHGRQQSLVILPLCGLIHLTKEISSLLIYYATLLLLSVQSQQATEM